ncbi:MAG: PEP-CTERM sorting domain-containing protein [Pseudomonadota bacterium]
MPTFRSALASLAFILAAPAALASNLVNNGDFENADHSMWLQTGDTSAQYFSFDYSGSPLSNLNNTVFADGAYPGPGYLGQLIATQAGARYTLEFDLQRIDTSNAGLGQQMNNEMLVTFGANTVFHQTNTSGDWTHYTVTNLTAAGSQTLLQFGDSNQYDYNQLDNVSLVMTAVPEPATAAMLMAGLVLMALRRHRRPPPF